MKGSKLSEILSTIPQKEWRNLKEYVSSPFFNKNQHLIDLLEIIHKALFYQKKQFPTKTFIWKKLFPHKKHNEQRLFILMSKLDKLCTDYINYQVFKENDITHQIFTLRASLHRKMPKHFKRTFEITETKLNKQSLRNADYYYHDYLLRVEDDFYNHTNAKKRNIIDVVQSLDNYYLVTKLRYLCSVMNRQDLLQVEEKAEIENFTIYLKKFDLKKLFVLRIYQLTLDTLLKPEETENYDILKNLLNKHKNLLAKNETKDLYLYLQNYLVKKLNAGQEEYIKDLFSLYKDMLDNVLLKEGGGLNLQYFKNIVTTALRQQAFEWTETFIKTHYTKLPKQDQEDAYCYNIGNLYFYQQKFWEAMQTLLQVNSRNMAYYLGAKSILLKSYYELEEEEALLSLTHSFATYIRRNKVLSDKNKRNYLNMIKFIKKMGKLRKGEIRKAKRLLQTLNETSNVMEKQWLVRKIKEIT
ncbi:MAG: hypothetical protein ACPG49_05010 [Chitinophagales bacterium]